MNLHMLAAFYDHHHLTIAWICAGLAWCIIGCMLVRTKMGWGDVIAMIHYNYPWLGWLMLLGCVILWPLMLLFTVLGSWIGEMEYAIRNYRYKRFAERRK